MRRKTFGRMLGSLTSVGLAAAALAVAAPSSWGDPPAYVYPPPPYVYMVQANHLIGAPIHGNTVNPEEFIPLTGEGFQPYLRTIATTNGWFYSVHKDGGYLVGSQLRSDGKGLVSFPLDGVNSGAFGDTIRLAGLYGDLWSFDRDGNIYVSPIQGRQITGKMFVNQVPKSVRHDADYGAFAAGQDPEHPGWVVIFMVDGAGNLVAEECLVRPDGGFYVDDFGRPVVPTTTIDGLSNGGFSKTVAMAWADDFLWSLDISGDLYITGVFSQGGRLKITGRQLVTHLGGISSAFAVSARPSAL